MRKKLFSRQNSGAHLVGTDVTGDSVGAGVTGERVGCGSVGLCVGSAGHGSSSMTPYAL